MNDITSPAELSPAQKRKQIYLLKAKASEIEAEAHEIESGLYRAEGKENLASGYAELAIKAVGIASDYRRMASELPE